MKPYIGQIVIYHLSETEVKIGSMSGRGGETKTDDAKVFPAIINRIVNDELDNNYMNLSVFTSNGVVQRYSVFNKSENFRGWWEPLKHPDKPDDLTGEDFRHQQIPVDALDYYAEEENRLRALPQYDRHDWPY